MRAGRQMIQVERRIAIFLICPDWGAASRFHWSHKSDSGMINFAIYVFLNLSYHAGICGSSIMFSHNNDFYHAVTSPNHLLSIRRKKRSNYKRRLQSDKTNASRWSLLSVIRALNHWAIRHLRSVRDFVKESRSPTSNAPVNEPNNRADEMK